MPTEDEIFFDQATRSRGQVEVSFDQPTRPKGQVVLKFSRKKWLEMDGYTVFHLDIISELLSGAKFNMDKHMAQLCTHEDVFLMMPESESKKGKEMAFQKPESLPRVLLAKFPIDSGDQKINIAVDGFKKIGEMLDLALARAGLSLDTTYTEYESIFGVKMSGSELRFAERCTIVRENITKMKDKLSEEWVLIDESNSAAGAGSVAYVTDYKVNKIFLGKLFFTRTTPEVAAVLIHEIGHCIGLQDICVTCHNIDAVKLPRVDPGACSNNNGHGNIVGEWAGHIITYPRALTLAVKNPDLATWNADAYRRYCLALYSAEMDVPAGGWKHHMPKPSRSWRFWR